MTKNGKLNEGIFRGATIDTSSMLCVEDYLDSLAWVNYVGGVAGMAARSQAKLATPDWFGCLSETDQRRTVASMTMLLAAEGVAVDIGGCREAPPGLPIWAGPTVENQDIVVLLPWLAWALAEVR